MQTTGVHVLVEVFGIVLRYNPLRFHIFRSYHFDIKEIVITVFNNGGYVNTMKTKAGLIALLIVISSFLFLKDDPVCGQTENQELPVAGPPIAMPGSEAIAVETPRDFNIRVHERQRSNGADDLRCGNPQTFLQA